MADLSQIRVSGTLYDIKDAVARQATGAPAVAATVSDMTDRNKVYVYTGSESGYTSGNWYYFNGSSWVSGGVYNSAAVETDTSLSVSGAPADAKVTGDSIKYIVSVGDTAPSQHTQLLFSESTTELDLVTTETFNSEISDLRSEIEQSGGGGQPVPVALASEMTDTDQIYVYLGEETGYDYGYIYVYLNNAWTKTGLYGRGQNGADGFSPQITVAPTSTGVSITATDKNGTTVATVENGTATAEQVASWLDNHPEATTTVQDGSVSVAKLSSDTMMLFKRIARIIAKALYKVDKSDEILDLKEAIGMTTYTINYSLAGATIDSDLSVIDELEGFTATVTKDDAEYIYKTATITMGGTDITSTAWNSNTGTISIPSVTGNVVITIVVTSEYGWADGVAYDSAEYPNVNNSTVNGSTGAFDYGSNFVRSSKLPCHGANMILCSGEVKNYATYDSEGTKITSEQRTYAQKVNPINPSTVYYFAGSNYNTVLPLSSTFTPYKLDEIGEETIPVAGTYYFMTNPANIFMRCYGMKTLKIATPARRGIIFYDTNKAELSRIAVTNWLSTATIPEGAVYFRWISGYENNKNVCWFEEA